MQKIKKTLPSLCVKYIIVIRKICFSQVKKNELFLDYLNFRR